MHNNNSGDIQQDFHNDVSDSDLDYTSYTNNDQFSGNLSPISGNIREDDDDIDNKMKKKYNDGNKIEKTIDLLDLKEEEKNYIPAGKPYRGKVYTPKSGNFIEKFSQKLKRKNQVKITK